MITEGETLENKPNSAAEGTRPRLRHDIINKPLGIRSNDKFGGASSMKSTAFTHGNPMSVNRKQPVPKRGQSIPGMGFSK
jgi:hypothetical protein